MAVIDLDRLVAIDVHTHAEVSEVTGCGALSPELAEAADRHIAAAHTHRPPAREMAQYYGERNMMAVVFTVDATTATGVPPVPNDEIAQAAADNPDALIAFGSVDPHLGRAAVNEVHRLVREHDVRGFEFHPSVQAFEPNDRSVSPAYEARLRGAADQAAGATRDHEAERGATARTRVSDAGVSGRSPLPTILVAPLR